MVLYGSDGRIKTYRRGGERYATCVRRVRVAFGGGSVMFWAGISFEGHTDLVFIDRGALNAHRYITEILDEHVMPFAGFIGENFIFMQENARPHVAAVVVVLWVPPRTD
ncbi:uncharacterized protein [Diabrotica undecimpunctata]|uniref:uncharacterized protein n=1 Tax=Diabrotica undecimpunctata TaxID=50387 RepID=UPI003B63F468